jgi:BASS family bile acid:Na+ symporter
MFDGVVLRIFAEPLLLLGLSAVTFIVALGSIGIAMIVLRAMGADEAFITGFATGHRNVGLMAAAQSGSFLPDLTWLYFALVQLPVVPIFSAVARHSSRWKVNRLLRLD